MNVDHAAERQRLLGRVRDLREKYFSVKSPDRKEKLFARSEAAYERARRTIPEFYRHGPVSSLRPVVFLVSYPRSGNTLAHRMLTTLFETHEDQAFPGSGPFTFSKLLYDPDEPRVRIVKDHLYRSEYVWDSTILVVRDGRDACLSLAHFSHAEGLHNFLQRGELADFLRFTRDGYPFGDWVRNVRTALDARRIGANVRIVRYEDLTASDACVLDLVKFIDPASEIDLSRIAEVRKEGEVRRKAMVHPSWGYGKTYGADSYLHDWSRNRLESNWRTAFDAKAAKLFHEMGATEVLRELNYETDPDWWRKVG